MKIKSLFTLLVCFCSFSTVRLNADNARKRFAPQDSTLDSTPYILPSTHPAKRILDKIFSNSKILRNKKNFKSAGFKTIFSRKDHVRVVRHPKIKGYLVKVFLNNDLVGKRTQGQQSLIRRCAIAAKVRRLITKHEMAHFTVPQKWLYRVPNQKRRTFILLAEDMRLVSREKSEQVWKKKITQDHLKELHVILRHGYGSLAAAQNIPYTKKGTFSFIDTEYPKRDFPLHRLGVHLSDEMAKYWELLIKE